MSVSEQADAPELLAARDAVSAVFICAGLATASWASRIPQVRDRLHLSPGALGLILLSVAVGSLIALPAAGMVVHRFGAVRTVIAMSAVCSLGLALAGLGALIGVAPVMVGLALLGFGNGSWDVAMNVEAAAIEQRLGRSIMPRFHAGFSVGTVVGASVGALANAVHLSLSVHLVAVAALIAVIVPLAARRFLAAGEDHRTDAHRVSPLVAWRERRTLLIGLFVLTMAFTEGTGNDWLGVAAIDGYRASAAVGSLTYVLFVAAMTMGRWYGPHVLDRHGRVLVMRAGALSSLVGVLAVVFGQSLWVAFAGVVLWGLGVSLGFPVGMSAAADDPRRAAARVSVVATIGYVAFLVGPALIGAIGNHTGVLRALLVTAGLLTCGLLLAGATAPLEGESKGAPSQRQ